MLLSFLDKYEYETEQEYNNRILTCFLSEVYLFDDHVVLFFNISSPDGKLKECDFDIIKAGGLTKTNSCSTVSNLGGASCVTVEPNYIFFYLPYGFGCYVTL